MGNIFNFCSMGLLTEVVEVLLPSPGTPWPGGRLSTDDGHIKCMQQPWILQLDCSARTAASLLLQHCDCAQHCPALRLHTALQSVVKMSSHRTDVMILSRSLLGICQSFCQKSGAIRLV